MAPGIILLIVIFVLASVIFEILLIMKFWRMSNDIHAIREKYVDELTED